MFKIIFGILGALFIPVASWLGGYDFDSRGATAVFVFLESVGFTLVGILVGHVLDTK